MECAVVMKLEAVQGRIVESTSGISAGKVEDQTRQDTLKIYNSSALLLRAVLGFGVVIDLDLLSRSDSDAMGGRAARFSIR